MNLIKLNSPVTPSLPRVIKYLEEVHSRGWYTNFGPLHQLLTERLCEYFDIENLLLVSSGTAALQVAAKALDVRKAITTPFSFAATTSALDWIGVEMEFADIDSDTLNLCPRHVADALDASDGKVSGIVATHVYGNPCDIDSFESLAYKNDVAMIYDACHAFGVNFGDRSILQFGDASTLSFHATKVFHTVGGGAIAFRDETALSEARALINFGIDQSGSLGYQGTNAKLSEYQGAVGLAVVENIDNILERRRELFQIYTNRLSDHFDLPKWHSDASTNGAYMPIILDSSAAVDSTIDLLDKRGVQSRRYFFPGLNNAYSQHRSHGCSNSDSVAGRVLCLPMHSYLSNAEVDYVIDTLIGGI